MKVLLTATDMVVEVVGPEGGASVPGRVWEGTTDTGIAVSCVVTRIAVAREADQAQFEAELSEQRPPTAHPGAWPNRFVL